MWFMAPPFIPEETLDAMYPDVYNRVYPAVRQMCERYDNPSNPGFYPYPTRAAVEGMADSIYQQVAPNLGMSFQQRRRGLLRPLILILLIRELLRRRRRRRIF